MSITKAQLEAHLEREEQRKALNRQAADLKRASDLFEADVQALVESEGKHGRLLHRGFLLAIEQVRGAVKWKDEFIRVAGTDEAARLAAAAPMRDDLVITRAA